DAPRPGAPRPAAPRPSVTLGDEAQADPESKQAPNPATAIDPDEPTEGVRLMPNKQ
ncbi:MAG: hypothetical protein JO242_20600, partial [Streptosporangiaceae bacterium]|nr:hypothetical protein [Streptosporangiaceae bacterium]